MHVMESAPGAETIIDGRTYLYFCGTGYLGLQGHRELIAAACEATQRYGLGTATTRAVNQFLGVFLLVPQGIVRG